MAAPIITIPTLEPPEWNVDIFGLKNIAIGKAVGKLPEPYQAVANEILHPSTAQDIINDFLTRMPDPQQVVKKPALNVPTVNDNPMNRVAGATLGGGFLYSNLEIEQSTWTDFIGKTKGYNGMIFNTVLLSVQQNKNIVETEVQGSDDGAVFEYSGLNNYEVTINIIITGERNGVYPSGPVQDIIKMLESPYAVKVNSWYLNMFNIFELQIMGYSSPQEAGGISQQAITINAKSNKRTTLIIQ